VFELSEKLFSLVMLLANLIMYVESTTYDYDLGEDKYLLGTLILCVSFYTYPFNITCKNCGSKLRVMLSNY